MNPEIASGVFDISCSPDIPNNPEILGNSDLPENTEIVGNVTRSQEKLVQKQHNISGFSRSSI